MEVARLHRELVGDSASPERLVKAVQSINTLFDKNNYRDRQFAHDLLVAWAKAPRSI